MSKVTAIITTYRPEPYLLDAVKSVVEQTRPAHEIFLISDGAGAEYRPILDQVQQQFPHVVVIHQPVNRGVAAVRNVGIARASGNYISFLDDDDLWTPDKIAVQAAYLDAHPECDYVTSRQRYFLADGVTGQPSWVKPEHLNGSSLPGFLPGTLMARKEAFATVGTFNESLTAGTDDVDWFFRANTAGRITRELPNELMLKRIHQQNLSAAAHSHNKELLSVVRMNLARRKQAKLSVIIPCYNGKAFIKQALESVLAQGDSIGEIIVVDDASSDGSADYVEQLALPGVVVHRLPRNLGIGGARNAGIALARHDTIAFLDADDLWPAGRNLHLLTAMEQQNTPWAFGGIEHFSDSDQYKLPPVQTGYFASAMLVRAAFLRTVGPFNEQLKVGEFIDWFDRARAEAPAPAVVAEVVLKRRIHGSNSSLIAGNKHATDYLKVARAAIARKKAAS